jgi:prepilin peptidase CpaA
LGTALYTDLRYGKIYNCLTFGMMGVGIALNGVVFGVKGIFVPVLILGLPFALGWIGAGDLKLLMAVGALMGPGFAFLSTLATCMVGGLLAGVRLVRKRELLKRLRYIVMSLVMRSYTPPRREERLTYSVAICVGTLIAYAIKVTGVYWD